MRDLFVGDPHAVPDELGDCQALMDLIMESVEKHRVERVIFLGDLHHTMSVLRVEVLQFWRDSLEGLREIMHRINPGAPNPIVVLKGNHDAAQDKAHSAHALLAYDEIVRVVDRPWVDQGVLYVPWMYDPQEFVAVCRAHPEAPSLVCHQEFNGAQYDNGMYAPNGVNPEDIPQVRVVAGHIHRPQRFGRVWYVGAPRWRSTDDVGQDRFLELVDIGPGAFTPLASIPTDTHCRRLVRVEDAPETPWQGPAVPHWRYVVDIRGPRAWLDQRSRLWAGQAVLRTYSTDIPQPRVRESEGVYPALTKYLSTYTAPHGTDRSILTATVSERLCLS